MGKHRTPYFTLYLEACHLYVCHEMHHVVVLIIYVVPDHVGYQCPFSQRLMKNLPFSSVGTLQGLLPFVPLSSSNHWLVWPFEIQVMVSQRLSIESLIHDICPWCINYVWEHISIGTLRKICTLSISYNSASVEECTCQKSSMRYQSCHQHSGSFFAFVSSSFNQFAAIKSLIDVI